MSIVIDTKKMAYDSLSPDANITGFLAFCRDVKSRYEGNLREIAEREAELQDLDHYAELHGDLDIRRGFALYKKIRDVRRERRKCKSENELLAPMYNWIFANDSELNCLSVVLGQVRKTAEVIDNRKYMTRTGVLEE